MAGRKIRDEADAHRCLRAAGSAGGSDVEWANAHGVDARSLQAWRMNLGRRGAHKGHHYYAMEGRKIALPDEQTLRPSREHLEWHQAHVFLQ